MPILQFLETIPFSLPILIPPTEESPSSETAFSLWSYSCVEVLRA